MLKRSFDLFIVVVAIVVLAPVLLGLGLLVRIFLGTPILFRQTRVGLGNAHFQIVKFRTMTDERGEDGELLPDAVRLTKFGRFLRSTSLDELPELYNILRGEMSIVGPRPLLVEYLPLYNARQALRHSVRPGLTGWAQISGRNSLDWDERLECDVWYVENRSFWLDLKIIGRTFYKVMAREGISAAGSATMSPFKGNRSNTDDL